MNDTEMKILEKIIKYKPMIFHSWDKEMKLDELFCQFLYKAAPSVSPDFIKSDILADYMARIYKTEIKAWYERELEYALSNGILSERSLNTPPSNIPEQKMDMDNLIIKPIAIHLHPSFFTGCNYLNIEAFKERIINNLKKEDPMLGYESVTDRSEALMLLLRNKTAGLSQSIRHQINNAANRPLDYLPFFAWAAANNKTECIDNINFQGLFSAYKESAKAAVVIAAAFGSKEFLSKAYGAGLIAKEDIRQACAIAAAHKNNLFLEQVFPLLKETNHFPFFNQREKVSGLSFTKYSHSPLFWAIRNQHSDTVELLLRLGISPNGIANDVNKDSHLQFAVRINEVNAVRLLLNAKADLNYIDALGKTVFDYAEGNETMMQLLRQSMPPQVNY